MAVIKIIPIAIGTKIDKSTMINWGHKITIFIIAFILVMLSMVAVAYQQTNDMVDTNYYEKEMKYQGQINSASQLDAITLDTLVNQNIQTVFVQIPAATRTSFNKGKIEFLRIDDKRKDVVMAFTPDENGYFNIGKERFSKGLYKVRVQWDNNQQHYYREQDLIMK